MKAKRSLGQNFLTAPSVATCVADAAGVGPGVRVLEIGPGQGALTKVLLEKGATVVAIEKDDELFDELQVTFAQEVAKKQLRLVHGDALEKTAEEFGLESPYVIAANIPYNLTGALLRHWLTGATQPKTMALLVQKEVAERVVARDGKESLLSMSVKVYGTPHYLKTVKAGSFFPKPNVDSAALAISDISRDRFANQAEEERFFTLLKAGFAQKRKQLQGNLAAISNDPTGLLTTCGLPPTIRAEKLTVQDWICLTKAAT